MTRSTGLLDHPPTPSELERLYHELALRGAPSVGRESAWPYDPRSSEQLVALASEMLRYDARLLSILLQYLLEHWQSLNPLLLRTQMKRMRWPQALLVVCEFARTATHDPEFRHFNDYLMAGFARLNPAERFFLDMERPDSRTAHRRAHRNMKAYKRWGFIGTERPTTNVMTKESIGTSDAATRALVRQQLARRRGTFSLRDYLDALDHGISRQQAYADLKMDQTFALTGRGRGARWRARGEHTDSAAVPPRKEASTTDLAH